MIDLLSLIAKKEEKSNKPEGTRVALNIIKFLAETSPDILSKPDLYVPDKST